MCTSNNKNIYNVPFSTNSGSFSIPEDMEKVIIIFGYLGSEGGNPINSSTSNYIKINGTNISWLEYVGYGDRCAVAYVDEIKAADDITWSLYYAVAWKGGVVFLYD